MRGLKRVCDEMSAAGQWEKFADGMLAVDERLLNGAGMNRCLKKRGARGRKTIDVALERAALRIGGGVDDGVVGARSEFIERGADEQSELSHAPRGAARKAILEALARGGEILGAGLGEAESVEEAFNHD